MDSTSWNPDLEWFPSIGMRTVRIGDSRSFRASRRHATTQPVGESDRSMNKVPRSSSFEKVTSVFQASSRIRDVRDSKSISILLEISLMSCIRDSVRAGFDWSFTSAEYALAARPLAPRNRATMKTIRTTRMTSDNRFNPAYSSKQLRWTNIDPLTQAEHPFHRYASELFRSEAE